MRLRNNGVAIAIAAFHTTLHYIAERGSERAGWPASPWMYVFVVRFRRCELLKGKDSQPSGVSACPSQPNRGFHMRGMDSWGGKEGRCVD
jgi:hypothetical protein